MRWIMQVSIRVSPETSALLTTLAKKTGKTKTALILEAVDEKYTPKTSRPTLVRELAGWMPQPECDELRDAVADFGNVDENDRQ
jgi:hypothetical protein